MEARRLLSVDPSWLTDRRRSLDTCFAPCLLLVLVLFPLRFAGLPLDLQAQEPAERAPPTDSATVEDSPYHGRGFIRQTFHGMRLPDDGRPGEDRLYSSATTLRLEGTYRKDDFRAEASANAQGAFTSDMADPASALLWASRTRNRVIQAEKVTDDGDAITRLELHRAVVAYRSSTWNITAGRQAISWGEGRFLNPMDLITPVGPYLLDIEDVSGADAVSIQRYFNDTDSLQLVVVPLTRSEDRNLKRLRSEDANALMRFKGTVGTMDYVFVGGRHFHSSVWGTEATLTAKDASFRFAYLGRSLDPRYENEKNATDMAHQFIFGTGYAFFKGKLRTSEEILVNTGFTGSGGFMRRQQANEAAIKSGLSRPTADDSSFFLTSGRIVTRNPWLFQGSAGGDVADLWKLDVIVLYDIYGKSGLYGPQLGYNFSQEGMAALGCRFYFFSKDRTQAEFQGAHPEVFGYVRLYF